MLKREWCCCNTLFYTMMNMPIAVSCIMCGMNIKENSAPFAFNSCSAEFDDLVNTLKDISIYLLLFCMHHAS